MRMRTTNALCSTCEIRARTDSGRPKACKIVGCTVTENEEGVPRGLELLSTLMRVHKKYSTTRTTPGAHEFPYSPPQINVTADRLLPPLAVPAIEN
eukprot:1423828-Pyramimonas_sp.AAC.1